MNGGLLSIIAQHRRLFIVIGLLCIVGIITVIVISSIKSQSNDAKKADHTTTTTTSTKPIDLKNTNLAEASSDVQEQAAKQMTIDIKGMPSILDSQTIQYMDNQLAYILRQKYGPSATSLTANVRQVLGFVDGANGLQLYVDVPGKNETYLAYINIQNQVGTFVCAPQDQQMNPSTSNCFTLPSTDESSFPNG